MAVDEQRHPHYGGRKRPAECDVCHRIVLCLEVDSPDGTGEWVCPQCVATAIAVAWDSRGMTRVAKEAPGVTHAYDNEQCPARAEGYAHRTDGRFNCSYCGVRLYHAQRRPVAPTGTVDEDCPRRGPALKHRTDGGPTCIYCGTRVIRSEP